MNYERTITLWCPKCFSTRTVKMTATSDVDLDYRVSLRASCDNPKCFSPLIDVDPLLIPALTELASNRITTVSHCSVLHEDNLFTTRDGRPHLVNWEPTLEQILFVPETDDPWYRGPYVVLDELPGIAAADLHHVVSNWELDEEFVVDYQFVERARYKRPSVLPIPEHCPILLTVAVRDYEASTLRIANTILCDVVSKWVEMLKTDHALPARYKCRYTNHWGYMHPTHELV